MNDFLKDKQPAKRPDIVTHWCHDAPKTKYKILGDLLHTFYSFSPDTFKEIALVETREGMDAGPIAFQFTKCDKTTILTNIDKIFNIFAEFIAAFYKSQFVHNIQLLTLVNEAEFGIFVSGLCVYESDFVFVEDWFRDKLMALGIECSFAKTIRLMHYVPHMHCNVKFDYDADTFKLETTRLKGVFKVNTICFRKYTLHPTNRICEIVKQFIRKTDKSEHADAIAVPHLHKIIGEKVPWVARYTSREFIKNVEKEFELTKVYGGDGYDNCKRMVGYKLVDTS